MLEGEACFSVPGFAGCFLKASFIISCEFLCECDRENSHFLDEKARLRGLCRIQPEAPETPREQQFEIYAPSFLILMWYRLGWKHQAHLSFSLPGSKRALIERKVRFKGVPQASPGLGFNLLIPSSVSSTWERWEMGQRLSSGLVGPRPAAGIVPALVSLSIVFLSSLDFVSHVRVRTERRGAPAPGWGLRPHGNMWPGRSPGPFPAEDGA